MKSSFNAFGTVASDYGKSRVPVWLGTVTPVPVGGTLDDDYLIAGALYPAGTPVKLENKKITPLVSFVVTAFAADASGNDTITVKPFAGGILPSVGDFIQKVGATFAATGKSAAVVSVNENATTPGTYDIAVAHSATVDTPSAGDVITFSAATAAGSGKSIAAVANGYLYNDIYLGNIDVAADAAATGAVVMYHAEGLLIDLTPAAEVKAQMAAAVPHVLQVSV